MTLTGGSVTDDSNQKIQGGNIQMSKSLHYIHLFFPLKRSLTAVRSQRAEQFHTVKSVTTLSLFLSLISKDASRSSTFVLTKFKRQFTRQIKGDQFIFLKTGSSSEQPTGSVMIHQYLLSTQRAGDSFV